MKKYYFLSFLMAVLAFGFVSCGSDSDDNDNPSPTKNLNDPKYKRDARTLTNQDNEGNIQSVELTESGKYILTTKGKLNASKKAVSRVMTDNVELFFYVGDYIPQDENGNYVLQGLGTLHISYKGLSGELTLILDEGGTLTLNIDIAPQEAFDVANDLMCRTWTIDKTRVRFTDGLTAAADFNGCDLNEIAAFVNKYATFNDNFESNHKVKDLTITHSHTYMITYQSGTVEVGTWSWRNVSNGNFYYTWKGSDMGSDLENGDAFFSVEDGKGILTVSGVIKDDTGKEYKTGMTYTMSSK